MMTLYHGTGTETSPFTMYFTPDIKEAKDFALHLDDLGNYNEESYVYATEIDEDGIAIEEDFDIFDALAYNNEELEGYSSDIVYNPESGWYIVKNPRITLIEHYKNIL